MGRRRSRKGEALLYGLIGIVAIIIAIGQFLLEHIWIVVIVVCIPLAIFLAVRFAKSFDKKNKIRKGQSANSFNLVDYHLENARKAEEQKDFYNARKEYRRCVSISKTHETQGRHDDIVNEYENFVKRDPAFSKVVAVLTAGIQDSPGIKIYDIRLNGAARNWPDRYHYAGNITSEDISYYFDYAEKFGYIKIDASTGKLSIPSHEDEPDEHTSRLDNASHHIEQARKVEQAGDYLGARVSYMQCVESLRHANAPEELEKAKKEYANFVRQEPIFNKLLPIFLEGVKQNPGILQSDITKKAEALEWSELRNYDRPLSKDDIRYVLYFAEEFGYLIRQKSGRSYRLYLPEQLKNVSEVQV